ncbi:type IV pilus modification PilV family protein [Microbacterium sp. P5_E9]
MRIKDDTRGFGVVEIIVSMFLLAIIAVAILPALWTGIRLSSEQAIVATATRQLNSMVDQARQSPTCAALLTTVSSKSFTDGKGGAFATSGVRGLCGPKASVSITLTATQSGRTLATASALVYVP